ncbi:MAG: class I SAM-dependent methyltransferase [Pirellulales bacterium]
MLVANNGLRWTLLFSASAVLTGVVAAIERRLRLLESRHGLPGFYAPWVAGKLWDLYDWRRGGEEWTASAEWKDALVDSVMYRWLDPGATVLEIGPGAGRWTEALVRLASRLILVDVSARSLDVCRGRFAGVPNIEYHVNDGAALTAVLDEAVDFIWSFDVFVHISAETTAGYIKEFRRVLRPGGRAIIHHTADGGWQGRWRTRMTAEMFRELVRDQGLVPLEQFTAWGDQSQFRVPGDAITVITK